MSVSSTAARWRAADLLGPTRAAVDGLRCESTAAATDGPTPCTRCIVGPRPPFPHTTISQKAVVLFPLRRGRKHEASSKAESPPPVPPPHSDRKAKACPHNVEIVMTKPQASGSKSIQNSITRPRHGRGPLPPLLRLPPSAGRCVPPPAAPLPWGPGAALSIQSTRPPLAAAAPPTLILAAAPPAANVLLYTSSRSSSS